MLLTPSALRASFILIFIKKEVLLLKNSMLLLCLIAFANLYSQELPKTIPPSPTSQQFHRYGDIPISHYTGIPDISIPIYTIKTGDISVPIYLSYHSGGTRIADLQEFGYIGLGWTLQAGGMISRQINGLPDHGLIGDVKDGFPDYTNQYEEMREIEHGNVDSEFDIWSYSFLGRNGKFIPIDPNNLESSNSFLFKHEDLKFWGQESEQIGIGDEEGRVFAFGSHNHNEVVQYQQGSLTNYATSTWHLTSIRSSRHPGSLVTYEYQLGKVINAPPTTYQYIIDAWNYSIENCDNFDMSPVWFPYSINNNNNVVNSTNSLYYHTRVPSRIIFPSGYILFHLNGQKIMERIEVFDNEGNLLKKVRLETATFAGTYGVKKLSKVVFQDTGNNDVETYSFDYYMENEGGTLGKDHWGFANGTPFNHNYMMRYLEPVPQGSLGFSTRWMGGSANRDVSEYYTKVYILQRITYPTKGYTEFAFEGNKNAFNAAVGGLRIAEISSYTAEGKLAKKKQFSYYGGSNEVWVTKDLYRKSATYITNDNNEAHRMFIFENPVINIAPKGTPGGYQQVTETEGDQTTTFTFDNSDAYTYEELNFPGYTSDWTSHRYKIFANNYKPWNFGSLKSKTVSSPGYCYQEVYNYEEFLKGTVNDLVFERVVSTGCVARGPGDCFLYPCNSSEKYLIHVFAGSSVYNFAKRYYHSGGKRLKDKWVTQTDKAGRPITTTTTYFYDNPNYPTQVSRQETFNSKKDTLSTQFQYPTDLATQEPYKTMVERNIIAPVIKEAHANNGQNVKTMTTRYNAWYNNAWYTSSSGPINENSTFLPQTVEVKAGSGQVETVLNYHTYNSKGNPLSISRQDNNKQSYIWDYNSSYPIAEVKNSEADQIAYTSFEADGKGNWAYTAPAITATTAPPPTGKKYYVLTATEPLTKSVTNGAAYIVSYWRNVSTDNPFNVTGATGTVTKGATNQGWTYFEHRVTASGTAITLTGSGNVDEVRLYPADAQMNSYTYKPLSGITSQSDPSGKITYYEYDNYGRLSTIKDSNRNIVKKYCYNYAGQTVSCD